MNEPSSSKAQPSTLPAIKPVVPPLTAEDRHHQGPLYIRRRHITAAAMKTFKMSRRDLRCFTQSSSPTSHQHTRAPFCDELLCILPFLPRRQKKRKKKKEEKEAQSNVLRYLFITLINQAVVISRRLCERIVLVSGCVGGGILSPVAPLRGTVVVVSRRLLLLSPPLLVV